MKTVRPNGNKFGRDDPWEDCSFEGNPLLGGAKREKI